MFARPLGRFLARPRPLAAAVGTRPLVLQQHEPAVVAPGLSGSSRFFSGLPPAGPTGPTPVRHFYQPPAAKQGFPGSQSHQNRDNHRRFSFGSNASSSRHTSSSGSTRPWMWFAGAGAALGVALAPTTLADAKACGIIATIGDEDALPFLLEGLLILQNRGYDSVGLATADPESGDLLTSKFASRVGTSDCLDILAEHAPAVHAGAKFGVAHTRWATHGAKTDANAHPHGDSKGRLALVHNGTIQNFHELKKRLLSQGVQFKSETDTELIAQLVGLGLDEGLQLLDAVKKALSQLEGTWGIALIHKDHPNQVIAARNGSPLVVGVGDHRMFVASEVSAFSRHTQKYIALKDGDIAVVTLNGVTGIDLRRLEDAPHEEIQLRPDPYPHWTLKEIEEQPEALQRTLGNGGRFDEAGRKVKLGGLDDNAEALMNIRHLVLSGCGTSLFASRYAQRLMQSLRCFETVQAWDAAEMSPDCLPRRNAGLVAVSQSGETKDTHRAVELAQEVNIPVMGVVNQVGSLIARSAGCGVYLHAGREHAVASTKAFTTQVTALALMAAWFAQHRTSEGSHLLEFSERRRQLMEAVHRLPICAGIALNSGSTRETVQRVAKKLVSDNTQHMFILGKGYGEPIAYEGALKIKEISYVHAEGFGGGSLKHGPFALLEVGTPVVLLILDDPNKELMRIAAEEVKARGAYNIVITDNPSLAENCSDEMIVIPSNGPLTALLGVLPLQLLAYEMSVLKGINPDKPKNLAKSVTVD